jgi:hypothetical protein
LDGCIDLLHVDHIGLCGLEGKIHLFAKRDVLVTGGFRSLISNTVVVIRFLDYRLGESVLKFGSRLLT